MICPYCSSDKLLERLDGTSLEMHIQLHADLLKLRDLFLDMPIAVTAWEELVSQSIVDTKLERLSVSQEMLS